PTEVRGKGFEMHLAKDNQPKKAAPSAKIQPKQPANDNGGIGRIRIHSGVEMDFWVDASARFLGGTPNSKNPVIPSRHRPRLHVHTPPDKAHIHVKTGGPFLYDLTKESAWFESPPPRENGAANIAIAPDQVHVVRLQMVKGERKVDQLSCDR